MARNVHPVLLSLAGKGTQNKGTCKVSKEVRERNEFLNKDLRKTLENLLETVELTRTQKRR